MARCGFVRLAAFAAAASLAFAGCGGEATPTRPAATATANATPTAAPRTALTADGHIIVRWFIGLGSGTNPTADMIKPNAVRDFNALQDARTDGKPKILLSLEIVQNDQAADILAKEMASGNAPDLIGPEGINGRAGFAGEFMDMTSLIKSAGFDTSVYPPALLNTMRDGQTGALLGLPYGVYPSFIFYNKDLFDEAGLKYPPAKVGAKYTMPDGSKVPWNWDTVRRLGMLLSLDQNGKNATQAGFDSGNQTQFGFEFQWTEGRRLASAFGSGSLVSADGKTAHFPDAWRVGWK
jgi:multiple sugar transport system substrate-binding protein